MTKRDYFFQVLNSQTVFFCQYVEDSNANFGGSWLMFDETCFCSDVCDASDFFDFTGCADLLNRVDITCSLKSPCTIESICPFADHRIQIKTSDDGNKFFNDLYPICLDDCASLAGYTDFSTLVAVSTSFGVFATGALANTPFGTSIGVPQAFLPTFGKCNIF